MLFQLDNLPPGYLLNIARMSPAANFAHALLCIQHGKDNAFKEWYNHSRNQISGPQPAGLIIEEVDDESADEDDSGFVEGGDETEEVV